MTSDRLNIASGSPYEPIIGFCRAVRVGNMVAVAGTAPIGPDGKTVGKGDAEAQAKRCLEVIATALEEAGSGVEHVVRTRIFLTDAKHWQAVSRAHGALFADIRPASTMLQVAALLDPDWLVEIEADAVLPPSVARVWPA